MTQILEIWVYKKSLEVRDHTVEEQHFKGDTTRSGCVFVYRIEKDAIPFVAESNGVLILEYFEGPTVDGGTK